MPALLACSKHLVSGVLRGRTREQLTDIFQQSFVCIRRFRSADRRLLPLILDQPKLIKYDCEPSAIAVDSGLQQACCPLPPVDKKDHRAVAYTPEMQRGLRLFGIYEAARGRATEQKMVRCSERFVPLRVLRRCGGN